MECRHSVVIIFHAILQALDPNPSALHRKPTPQLYAFTLQPHNPLTPSSQLVVARRYSPVTGQEADEKTLDHLIETGESETIFQKAIMEQVPLNSSSYTLHDEH